MRLEQSEPGIGCQVRDVQDPGDTGTTGPQASLEVAGNPLEDLSRGRAWFDFYFEEITLLCSEWPGWEETKGWL